MLLLNSNKKTVFHNKKASLIHEYTSENILMSVQRFVQKQIEHIIAFFGLRL